MAKQDLNKDEIEFSVFCIENVASALGLKGEETYQLLAERSDILDEYIIPNYEVLHTQDKQYIVNDIIEYMSEGLSDMHCRSDGYLAEELREEFLSDTVEQPCFGEDILCCQE